MFIYFNWCIEKLNFEALNVRAILLFFKKKYSFFKSKEELFHKLKGVGYIYQGRLAKFILIFYIFGKTSSPHRMWMGKHYCFTCHWSNQPGMAVINTYKQALHVFIILYIMFTIKFYFWSRDSNMCTD